MKISILGGGLSAVSLAYFLQENKSIDEIEIIEKESKLGGLCRSFELNGIAYDIGPHIIFSKDQEILDLMNGLLGENKDRIRRSNRIIHGKTFIQYPFENDLSKLPSDELEYCVNGFINNPYENYDSNNMLQFFLKTFGEGITNLYLRPYNQKIWKFDSAFMDTQMVERIPKPPKEDILRSAEGKTVDGYVHQLFFTYPKTNGIKALISGFVDKLNSKVKIFPNNEIISLKKESKENYVITTNHGKYYADKLVSTIPVNILANIYSNKTEEIINCANSLRYNSIIIAIINTKVDVAGDNFAFMIADSNIIFHRISKLDFLGKSYHKDSSATYMIEVTYRKGDLIDKENDKNILDQIIQGLINIGFISSFSDVNFTDLKRFEYAYVIYDLMHKANMSKIREFFKHEGIKLNGRFGDFEYLNTDAIIRKSKELAERILR